MVQQDKSEAPGEDHNNADESEDNEAQHTSVDSDVSLTVSHSY